MPKAASNSILLTTLAKGVLAGRLTSSPWVHLRIAHFPGRTDAESRRKLAAWAKMNGIKTTFTIETIRPMKLAPVDVDVVVFNVKGKK